MMLSPQFFTVGMILRMMSSVMPIIVLCVLANQVQFCSHCTREPFSTSLLSRWHVLWQTPNCISYSLPRFPKAHFRYMAGAVTNYPVTDIYWTYSCRHSHECSMFFPVLIINVIVLRMVFSVWCNFLEPNTKWYFAKNILEFGLVLIAPWSSWCCLFRYSLAFHAFQEQMTDTILRSCYTHAHMWTPRTSLGVSQQPLHVLFVNICANNIQYISWAILSCFITY